MVAETPPQGTLIAVGGAQSAAGARPTADLEAIKQLATQTKAIGVILPPPDIRAIVDKTAQFVAKNGIDFERRILAQESQNVKFNFLTPTDPYHAFYKLRVTHFSGGGEKQEAAAAEGAAAAPAGAAAPAAAPQQQQQQQQQPEQQDAAATAAAAAAAAAVVTTRPLEKPEDEKYTVHVPEGLTALDLDVIKLTAQFVARNGKSFLTGLAQREASNPQFYFLKPTHSMFGLFTALADAYSAVMMPPKDAVARLQADVEDRAAVLERCLKRLEWDKVKAREAQEAADEAARERLAMMSIDWHDFVIVETIDFLDGEDETLPPPLSFREIVASTKPRIPGEEEEEQEQDAAAAGAAAGAAPTLDAEEQQLLAAAAAAAGGAGSDADMEVEEIDADHPPGAARAAVEEDEEDEEAPIKVVKDYVRPAARAGQRGGVYDPSKYVVSPITGELVPIGQMAEHMRVSLIDPRWKEQREAMLSKLRDSTRAGDDEITKNLVGLASSRPDIFGSTEEELREIVTAAVKEKETSGQGRAVVWDGQTQGGDALRNQMRAIADNRQQLAGGGALPPVVMPPRPGPAAPPPVAPPPAREGPVGEEPDAKRARTEFVLEPEEEFAARFTGTCKVRVQCPQVDGNDKLVGQMLEVEVASLKDSVADLKARLASVVDVAANKQKLNREGVGFLRDEFSLAYYNVGPEVVLTLGTKARGGRK